jgi:transposase
VVVTYRGPENQGLLALPANPSRGRNSQIHEALCEVLKEARERAELSQVAVSAALKRPPNFCHLVEKRRRVLNSIEMVRYCAVLQSTASTVYAEVERRLILRHAPFKR